MDQAATAKEETEKARAREMVDVAVASSYSITSGKLDVDKVIQKLVDAGATVSSSEFPIKVRTAEGYTFEIQSGGKVIASSGVTLSATKKKMFAGTTETIGHSLSDELAGNEVTWESSDTSVATVDNGTVTTMSASIGSQCQIIARCGTESATCIITIVDTIDNLDISNITQPMQLLANRSSRINFSDMWKIEDVVYRSENEGIASVSENGNIRGINAGTTGIILEGETGSKRIEIEVVNSITTLNVSPINIAVGETYMIDIVGQYEPYAFVSSNSNIATVDQSRNVYGIADGTTSIIISRFFIW